jgi:uncharacterized protein GlcG (DUF336 family)
MIVRFSRYCGLYLATALLSAQLVAPSVFRAQGLVTTQRLIAPLANELVREAVAACGAKNYPVSAVVVDLDGVRQAMLRGDGAAIHTVDSAYYKAYSAASLTLARKEESTRAVAERLAKNPPSTVPQTQLPNVIYTQGGLTIISGGNPVGALGVGGAPGNNIGEECGRAALAKIRERIK